jgi:hypothetical protein
LAPRDKILDFRRNYTLFAAMMSALLCTGCATDQQVKGLQANVAGLEEKLGGLNKKLDEVNKRLFERDSQVDPYAYFTWFNPGQEYHQILETPHTPGRFYVFVQKVSFEDTGFEIHGLVANLEALPKTTVKVECAITDESLPEELTVGFKTISFMPPGQKIPFSVFVPTSKTKILVVGVSISDDRT